MIPFKASDLKISAQKLLYLKKIKELFEALELPLLTDIRAQHRYYIDETGLVEGVGINGKHIGAIDKPGIKKKR